MEVDLTMFSFFKKNPPKVCPKCGNQASWRCIVDDASKEMDRVAEQSSFYGNPARGSFGQMTNRKIYSGKQKIRYRCDKCGYEGKY